MSGTCVSGARQIGPLEAFLRMEGIYVEPECVSIYMHDVEEDEGAFGIKVALSVVAGTAAVILVAWIHPISGHLPAGFRELVTLIVGGGFPLAFLLQLWPRWVLVELSANLAYYRGADGKEVEVPPEMVDRARAVQQALPGAKIRILRRGHDPLIGAQYKEENVECFGIWTKGEDGTPLIIR